MAVRQPRYPKEEFARRGDEIYEQEVRPKTTRSEPSQCSPTELQRCSIRIA